MFDIVDPISLSFYFFLHFNSSTQCCLFIILKIKNCYATFREEGTNAKQNTFNFILKVFFCTFITQMAITNRSHILLISILFMTVSLIPVKTDGKWNESLNTFIKQWFWRGVDTTVVNEVVYMIRLVDATRRKEISS